MGKFSYQEGDLQIAESLCQLCIHKTEQPADCCASFPEGIPEEIREDSFRCPYYQKKSRILL